MNKKTLTTAILSLGFLTTASTAYAGGNDDYIHIQNLGGTGDGPTGISFSFNFLDFHIPEIKVTPPLGGVGIKLNGKLKLLGNWDEYDEYYVKKGSYHGDAFVTLDSFLSPVIKKNFDFWCEVKPVWKIRNQFWFDCQYFKTYKHDHDDWDKNLMAEPIFTSHGQCYIDVSMGLHDLFKMNDRNAACNFLYRQQLIPRGPSEIPDDEQFEDQLMSYEDALAQVPDEILAQVPQEHRHLITLNLDAPVTFPIMFSKESLT